MTSSIFRENATVRSCLKDAVDHICTSRSCYVSDPVSDFTRKRKLPLDTLMQFLILSGGKSSQSELCEFFTHTENLPTLSALVQARSKLSLSAFRRVFHLLNSMRAGMGLKTFHGYHLLAVDGSDVNIPFDPDDVETLVPGREGVAPYSQIRLNAIYDTQNNMFQDLMIATPHKANEIEVLRDMLKEGNYPEKSIFCQDRGYESYNLMATFIEQDLRFVIRAKDVDSNGILRGLDLPKENEFDVDIDLTLTRIQTKEIKMNPKFHFMPSNQKFDWLPKYGPQFYDISYRVIRIKVSDDDKYICLLTNLDREEFPAAVFKELYHYRWREENAFRDLKYPIGMLYFHSKKRQFIYQEIYCSAILYNLTNMAIAMIQTSESKDAGQEHKYSRKATFSTAVTNVRLFLREVITYKDLCLRIQKILTPIRPGRKAPRNFIPKKCKGLVCRAA